MRGFFGEISPQTKPPQTILHTTLILYNVTL